MKLCTSNLHLLFKYFFHRLYTLVSWSVIQTTVPHHFVYTHTNVTTWKKLIYAHLFEVFTESVIFYYWCTFYFSREVEPRYLRYRRFTELCILGTVNLCWTVKSGYKLRPEAGSALPSGWADNSMRGDIYTVLYLLFFFMLLNRIPIGFSITIHGSMLCLCSTVHWCTWAFVTILNQICPRHLSKF